MNIRNLDKSTTGSNEYYHKDEIWRGYNITKLIPITLYK